MSDTTISRLRLIPQNARLADARKARGWTQKDMCLLTGIKMDILSKLECLRLIPTEELMDDISSALDLPIDYLFPEALLDAVKEGVFGKRIVELEDRHLVRLTEAHHLNLLTEETIGEDVDRLLLKQNIEQVLGTLSLREQTVLTLRFGLDGEGSRTLEAVGRTFGVTNERIRQIEAKALRKLRHPNRSKNLIDFLHTES